MRPALARVVKRAAHPSPMSPPGISRGATLRDQRVRQVGSAYATLVTTPAKSGVMVR